MNLSNILVINFLCLILGTYFDIKELLQFGIIILDPIELPNHKQNWQGERNSEKEGDKIIKSIVLKGDMFWLNVAHSALENLLFIPQCWNLQDS